MIDDLKTSQFNQTGQSLYSYELVCRNVVFFECIFFLWESLTFNYVYVNLEIKPFS